MYISKVECIIITWYEGLKISNNNQVDQKTLEKLNKKIDDLQFRTLFIIALLLLVIIVQIMHLWSESYLLDNLFIAYLGILTILFIAAIISFVCTRSNKTTMEYLGEE